MDLRRDAQEVARELAKAFASREEKHDRDGVFALDNFADLREAGFFMLNVPPSHGGLGARLGDTVEAIRSLAHGSPSMALVLAMHISVLAHYLVDPAFVPEPQRSRFGQQREWAWREAAAGKFFGVANSESGAHGDVHNSKAFVRHRPEVASPVCYMRFEDESDLQLTGTKTFSSAGLHADYFMAAARDESDRVEYFLVRNDHEAVRALSEWNAIGMRSSDSVTLEFNAAPVVDYLAYRGLLEGTNNRHWSTLSFTAVIAGTAESLLEEIRPNAKGRLQETEAVDFHLQVEATRAFLRHCVASEPAPADGTYRDLVRDCKTFAARSLTRSAASLYTSLSGGSYRFSSSAARKFRDLLAAPALRPPLGTAFDELIQDWNE